VNSDLCGKIDSCGIIQPNVTERIMIILKPGTLGQRIISAADAALASGALIPIPTNTAFIDDGGIRFAVRVLAGLRKKAEARKNQDAAERAGRPANPFLPPEPALTVAEVSDTHLAVLNKFNVVDRHLLIVTRHFEDQEILLTQADLEALCACMTEYDSLGFYNGGADAGASQRHKHLQIIPLPLAPDVPDLPTEPLLARAQTAPDGFGTLPDFPFRHVFARIDADLWNSPPAAAKALHKLYVTMLEHAGMSPPKPRELTLQSGPYCLLLTRTWMLLVPRSREHVIGISFNSLAYAGSLFVYNEELLEQIRDYGPMRAITEAGFPK
jgi:ATP adenylyltransferase